MQARAFWKTVTRDHADFLQRFLDVLAEARVRYCVIGGQGVNAYVDPVVSLDLDIVITAADAARIEAILAREFSIARFPHSLNVSEPGSDLRVQIQTDPRYAAFVTRAHEGTVLGVALPVAAPADLLQGKIWAAADRNRRPSKRQKDLADIARLIEKFPELEEHVPPDIRDRLV